jgi:hypothetical protein
MKKIVEISPRKKVTPNRPLKELLILNSIEIRDIGALHKP